MGDTELSGSIHTCDLVNYYVNLKVPEWAVYPFLCNFYVISVKITRELKYNTKQV